MRISWNKRVYYILFWNTNKTEPNKKQTKHDSLARPFWNAVNGLTNSGVPGRRSFVINTTK